MCKHELKYCPRCSASFECRVGDIAHCQCNSVKLTGPEQQYIADKYNDCICATCMIALQSEYNIAHREVQLKIFFNGR